MLELEEGGEGVVTMYRFGQAGSSGLILEGRGVFKRI